MTQAHRIHDKLEVSGALASGLLAGGSENNVTHRDIVSYRADGTFLSQLIQTKIPVDSLTMVTFRLRGYAFGTAGVIDLAVCLYNYSSPSGTINSPVYTSSGSEAPTSIRAAYVGGFLALELTWPTSGYYFRYAIDAYSDGTSTQLNSWFVGWTATAGGLLPSTAAGIVIVPPKSSIALASTIPLADGVADTRAGAIGTSLTVARADHIHPVSRLAIPTVPVIAAFGDMVINSQTPMQSFSDEESVTYHIQVQASQPASGGSWGGFTFPNLAGFQTPEWQSIGAYNSTPPYDMSQLRVTNWYGTGYANQYVRTVATSGIYYCFKVRYTLA
jgi:hypothetical protein